MRKRGTVAVRTLSLIGFTKVKLEVVDLHPLGHVLEAVGDLLSGSEGSSGGHDWNSLHGRALRSGMGQRSAAPASILGGTPWRGGEGPKADPYHDTQDGCSDRFKPGKYPASDGHVCQMWQIRQANEASNVF